MDKLLVVKNLTKDYKGFKAIDKISFEVGASEIFGLLGPNGAGKTTTIRTIATVLSPTSGTAEVLGYDIRKNAAEVRKNIGVLTTDIGVYDRFTGRENLEYFGTLYNITGKNLKQRINELSELLQMEEFINKPSGTYSTGMKQKLAIARAVIHDPKLIIFDEPTSGLDVLASQTVLNFMRQAKKLGKGVVLSTHQMPDAQKLCDNVAIIHQGKIVALGSVEKLKLQTATHDLEEVFLKLVQRKELVNETSI